MASPQIMFAALKLIEFPAGAYLSQFYEANNSPAVEMCAFGTYHHTKQDEIWPSGTGVYGIAHVGLPMQRATLQQ